MPTCVDPPPRSAPQAEAVPDSDLQIRQFGCLGDRPVRHYEHHGDYYYYFPTLAFINWIIIIKKIKAVYPIYNIVF